MATTRRTTRARLPRYGPGAAGVRLSPEDFDAISPERCADGYRYELIDGVLVVTPSPGIGERDPNGELEFLLRLYHATHPEGGALDATLHEQDVATGPNRRRADRVIWAGLGRLPDPRSDVPTIVIEFVSRGRRDFLRDYQEKRAEYLAAGVAEYWIIDRFRRTMTVYTPTPDGADAEVVIPEAGTYRTDRLPGFELPLARLFAAADRWAASSEPTDPPHRSRPRQGRRDQTDG